jgi:hypothetical protein
MGWQNTIFRLLRERQLPVVGLNILHEACFNKSTALHELLYMICGTEH